MTDFLLLVTEPHHLLAVQIIAVDARNHGDSGHSSAHTYELLAEDLRQFHRENGIQKSIVLGHSMGGRAMMVFALKYVR